MLRFSAMTGMPFRLGATPNPNAIRVGLGSALFPAPVTVRPGGDGTALLQALVSIPGVAQVFAMSDFITVTKDGAAAWDAIEPRVADVLMRHLNG
jgi:hypothetical protein